jgi:adenine-specific DNA-methyltransferase
LHWFTEPPQQPDSESFDLVTEAPPSADAILQAATVAPLLWMQAGAVGKCISTEPPEGWELAERYAVLVDIDASEPFVDALAKLEEPLSLVFVVTDSPSDFEDITGRLSRGTRAHRLYESYMRSFGINMESPQ